MTAIAHVERTDDERVLRWVCHDPALDRAGDALLLPPPGSRLASLLHEGTLSGIWRSDGDLVAAAPGGWTGVVREVHDHLLADLAERAAWLYDVTTDSAAPGPTPTPGTHPVVDASSTEGCGACGATGCGSRRVSFSGRGRTA